MARIVKSLDSSGDETALLATHFAGSEWPYSGGRWLERVVLQRKTKFFRYKALEDLVRAFERLRASFPVALLLVGDGPLRLSVPDGVEMPGYVPDVVPLYRRMRVFVNPSLHEGFGLAMAEAMGQGVPVVSTD